MKSYFYAFESKQFCDVISGALSLSLFFSPWPGSRSSIHSGYIQTRMTRFAIFKTSFKTAQLKRMICFPLSAILNSSFTFNRSQASSRHPLLPPSYWQFSGTEQRKGSVLFSNQTSPTHGRLNQLARIGTSPVDKFKIICHTN